MDFFLVPKTKNKYRKVKISSTNISYNLIIRFFCATNYVSKTLYKIITHFTSTYSKLIEIIRLKRFSYEESYLFKRLKKTEL